MFYIKRSRLNEIFFETSLDRFINDEKKMFYIKLSRLKIEPSAAK